MAKTTAPLLSFGGAGQIAQTLVYATWKGRPYARRYVVPSNPNSLEQQVTRSTFRNANGIWKLAGDLVKAPWDLFATGQVLTGRNAFVREFVRRLRAQTDLTSMIFSPGAKGGLPASALTVVPGVGELTLQVTPSAAPAGWAIDGMVGAAILDGDPETITLLTTTAAEVLAPPFDITLTGLTSASQYVVGAWPRWTKPDGSFAYGPSLQDIGTPT